MKTFKSILAFQKHFDTDEKCKQHLEFSRWGNTPACVHCGSINVCRFKTGKGFNCRDCRKNFTVITGTIYENTKIPLTKWYLATYILANHSKGISSMQLAGWLDVTQRTAWFINHRIRVMLTEKLESPLSGEIQIDETFVGGKRTNKHAWKREQLKEQYGIGYGEKTPVVGLLQKDGKVISFRIDKADQATLQPIINELVAKGATIMTDGFSGYAKLKENYTHIIVNHKEGEYVVNGYHTNTLEGFWSILKRQINGIHHFVSPQHLTRYCAEASYRYNYRALAQDEKFDKAVRQCEGRLKYKDLINTAGMQA